MTDTASARPRLSTDELAQLLSLLEGADTVTWGVGVAGDFQSPKTRSARAKPASGSMSPASTRTALSGR